MPAQAQEGASSYRDYNLMPNHLKPSLNIDSGILSTDTIAECKKFGYVKGKCRDIDFLVERGLGRIVYYCQSFRYLFISIIRISYILSKNNYHFETFKIAISFLF